MNKPINFTLYQFIAQPYAPSKFLEILPTYPMGIPQIHPLFEQSFIKSESPGFSQMQ